MAGAAAVIPKYQFSNSAGAPLANGTVDVYLAGTTTRTPSYQDSALTVLNTNPIALDAAGQATIWLDSTLTYKLVLKNAAGVTQWTEDNVTGAGNSLAAFTFTQAGTGAVARTGQAKMREKVSPLDFTGADLGVQITKAIAALPAEGGVVDLTMLGGAQSIPSQVLCNKANVHLMFGNATFTLSGVPISHDAVTFGAMFYVTVEDFWITGTKGTVFKLGAGMQSDAVVFGIGGSGGVLNIEMDGNKANNTSQLDDSFQSGIQIISGAPSTVEVGVTIEGCRIHDFNHYGIVTYGALSGKSRITGNHIYSNGKNDALGTGDGIYINLGSSRNVVSGNWCYSNQRSGIRISSVGVNTFDNIISGNWCYSNGKNGIWANEQLDVGSVVDIGQSGLEITGNHCYSNPDFGIRISTVNNVGVMKNFIASNNVAYSNGTGGILVEGNNHATSNTRRGIVSGNHAHSNTGDGIKIGAAVLDMLVCGNTCLDNSADQMLDLGTRTVKYGNKTNIVDGLFATGNPLFVAYQSATSAGVTGNNAMHTVICNTENHDALGNYNPATGLFTAPAGGRYRFSARVLLSNLTVGASTFLVKFELSTGVNYQNQHLGTYATLTELTLQIEEVIAMAAGDTLALKVLVNGVGANSVTVTGGAAPIATTFSGQYLG